MMVSANFTSSTMQSVVGTDAALVRSVVNTYVQPGDLDAGGPERRSSHGARSRLRAAWSDGPRSCASSFAARTGRSSSVTGPTSAGCPPARRTSSGRRPTGGTISAGIANVDQSEAVGPALSTSSVLREYFPLQADGRVQAVVGVWRDAVPILAELDDCAATSSIATLIAALVAAFVLFLVFRSAQGRITRQTRRPRSMRPDATR